MARFSRLLAASLIMLAAAVALDGVPALAQAPSAAEIEAFQNLPPDAQKQILQQMTGKQGQGGSSGTLAPAAPSLRPKAQAIGLGEDADAFKEPLRFRAGDSLILGVRLAARDGTRDGTRDGARDGVATAPDAQDTERIAIAGSAVKAGQARAQQDYLARLLKGNPYQLDRMGRLHLQGVPPIVLAGLTSDEAMARLNAEPRLEGFSFTVTSLPVAPELKPFGYDLFTGVPTTFAPAADIPVPSEYILGPGDVLEVQLIGEGGGTYSLTVGRDGTIDFPELGPIAVAGMRYPDAKAMLEAQVSEQMLGMRGNVSMGPLRSIQVFVLGEAERPGSYTVSGLSTITNALFASGGVKPIGSLRNVQLKRNGKLVKRLDLYDLLLNGDTSDDVRLLPGDVIFIPPIGPAVSVSGEVQRPAIYEIHDGDTAAEVISLAGGLTPRAEPREATLERIDRHRDLTVLDLDLTTPHGREMRLQAGDSVLVPAIRDSVEGAVTLLGYVYREGSVQYRPGMRLTDLVGSLDLLKPLADQHYVLIRRETGPTRTVSVLSADLAAAFADPLSEANVQLQARDTVHVFDLATSRQGIIDPILQDLRRQSGVEQPLAEVGVGGSVKVPGQYPLEPGMRVSDLLRAGGGLTDSAYGGSAELTRYQVVDGEERKVEIVQLDLGQIKAGDLAANLVLRPFDYVVIKQMPLWNEQQTVSIEGEVRFPGTYPIRRGESLKSVVDRAGGLTSMAFPQGSVYTREELKRREQEQMQKLADRLQRELTVLALQEAQGGAKADGVTQALAAGQSLLNDLENTEPMGRLAIDLEKAMAAQPGSPDDVILRGGDMLYVPHITQEVTVIGEVQGPTSHLYQPNLTRDDYIARSGGYTQSADKSRVYVIRANGEVVSVESTSWFSHGGANKIHAGDTIVVPLDAEEVRPITLWTAVTQILYNIAVAVAAVNSF